MESKLSLWGFIGEKAARKSRRSNRRVSEADYINRVGDDVDRAFNQGFRSLTLPLSLH